PLQLRARATRQALLNAAAAQFNQAGYAASSINDILASTTSSKGAIYFPFPSKQAMAEHLLDSWAAAARDIIALAASTGEPAERRIVLIYRETARRVQEDHTLRAGLILSLEPTIDTAANVYRTWIDALNAVVVDAVRAGGIDYCTAGTSRLAESLCAGFIGAVHVANALREPEAISRRVDDLLMLWLGTDPAAEPNVQAVAL
ncbi:MAG: TetR/AcrR family transcriptional regulator, partial [Rhodococcus sp. (in: high G+C Gram-positive bacteria)]|uniref:TetR family transcriptional regulator n=1 Tax=Rhodococcus sp. TaxID=1831 RepID=UPI003BB14522